MAKVMTFSLADVFTVINGVFGILAILFLLLDRIDMSFNWILLSVLADGMDGIIARRMGNTGGHLDELADGISFSLAPSLMIYMASDLQVFIRLAICFIFFICGIVHLIRYYLGKKDYFLGITTPSAALIVILFIYLHIHPLILFFASIIVSIMMISPILYPRLKGKFSVFAALLIFSSLILGKQYGDFALILLLSGVIIYIILGPFYVKAKFSKQKIHSH